MIRLNVKLEGLESMEHVARQLPFAMALAANKVAEDAQLAAQAGIRRRFTISPKREKFILGLVRRGHFATKREPWAEVGIGHDFGAGPTKNRSFLLLRHQLGGQRVARNPLYPFAIPTKEVRPGPYGEVPQALSPKNLRIFERRGVTGNLPIKSRLTRRGKVQIQGKRGAFVIDDREGSGTWGIFQRTGPGKRDIRRLFSLRQKIDLPPRLQFYEAVNEAVRRQMGVRFDEALKRALATAR